MPYVSKRQRAYLHAKKPKVAAKFDKHSGGKIKPKKGKAK